MEALVQALKEDCEAVRREKETMAQAIVKATALVAQEKKLTKQRYSSCVHTSSQQCRCGDEMKQHVAAQLYCRLREWMTRASSK